MAQVEHAEGLRPHVRTGGSGNLGLWLFLGVLALAGVMLFNALDARRQAGAAPQTMMAGTAGGMIAAPPPLTLPPSYLAQEEPFPMLPVALPPPPPPPPQVVTRYIEQPARQGPPAAAQVPLEPALPEAIRPAIVYDAAVAQRPASPSPQADERVLATRLANPSLTVPKGTVIPAVLESALDSTRPGAARALVTRDVLGFDGSRVLIQRGSRLYGEYASDMTLGQNRALIRWTRLLRPDGVMINLDSPSADPLGRAGVGGKVNTHFFARFGSAILQSALDLGVGLATRSVSRDGVVLALPGSTQNLIAQPQTQIAPTLTVKQGTSVSVFVAKDLDFSPVEN